MAWVKDDWGRLARTLGGVGAGYLGQREKERAHGLREREVTSAEERAAAYIEALNQQTEAGKWRQQQDVQAANYLQRPMGEAFADPSQVPVGQAGQLQQYQTGQRAVAGGDYQKYLLEQEKLERGRAQEPISEAVMGLFGDEQIPQDVLGELTREEFAQVLPYYARMGADARAGALGEGGPGFEPAMGNFMLKLEGNMRDRALNELIVQDISQGGTLDEDISGIRDPMTGDINWEVAAQLLGPERWHALSNMSQQMTDQWLMDQIGFEGGGAAPGEQQAPGPEAEITGPPQAAPPPEAAALPTDAQLREWYLAQHPAVGTPQPGMAPQMGALAQDPAAILTLARSEWEQQPAGAGFTTLGRPGEQRERQAKRKTQKAQARGKRQKALKKKPGAFAGGRGRMY